MKILGIDPGTEKLGLGLIWIDGGKFEYCESKTLVYSKGTLEYRFYRIFWDITEYLTHHHPDEIAIEGGFYLHAHATDVLSTCRGVIIGACAHDMQTPVFYQPALVKKAVGVKGNVSKEEVRYMVHVLLNISDTLSLDESDALAVAICHANRREQTQFFMQVERNKE